MFQTAELGQTVSKEDFDHISNDLRTELLALQQDLRSADFSVIVVFAGVDGAGKGESVNLINEWMDPRWIVTQAYDEPSDEERERPAFWRFWSAWLCLRLAIGKSRGPKLRPLHPPIIYP